jgi:hypothetical protein
VIQVQYKLFPNDVVWLQALDTFNTAVVSPIYYAGFTSFTILASAIMFKVLLCAHAHGKRERECVRDPWLCFCVCVCVGGGGFSKEHFLTLPISSLKDYSGQSASSIASELCGFLTVLSGTAVLHSTREPDSPTLPGRFLLY